MTIQLSPLTSTSQKASLNHISRTTICHHFHGSQFLSQPQHPLHLLSPAATSSHTTSKSPQKNFTACFNQWKRTPTDKLMEFWQLPQEDFNTCNPLQWWHGRCSQFPNLSHLVHDIFSIPGKVLSHSLFIFILLVKGLAVAVERIFSGGHDTISLHHASLKPETIQMLILVKRKLILARECKGILNCIQIYGDLVCP